FPSRLDEFMRLSHAVIVAPGGVGTMLELVYVWQLIQVRLVERRPVLLLQSSFWEGLLAWMRAEMLGRGFISPGDFDWVRCVDSPSEALEIIRGELQRFTESLRQKPHAGKAAEHADRIAARLDEAVQQPEQGEPLPRLTAVG